MKRYYNEKVEEHTILKPFECRFEIDVNLFDCDYIAEPNGKGLFTFNFIPDTGNDYMLLENASFDALNQAMSGVSPDSNKELQLCYEGRSGVIFTSQLFQPKLNLTFYNPYELENRKASLTCHWRDSVDGKIYLQAEYVDVYEQVLTPQVTAHLEDKESDPDDWLF